MCISCWQRAQVARDRGTNLINVVREMCTVSLCVKVVSCSWVHLRQCEERPGARREVGKVACDLAGGGGRR